MGYLQRPLRLAEFRNRRLGRLVQRLLGGGYDRFRSDAV